MEHQTLNILLDALERLNEGLQLLDEAQAPGDIGAYVDLAIERLKAFVAQTGDTHLEVILDRRTVCG